MARELAKWLRKGTPDRVIYADPPLALVICQIRFPKKIKATSLEVASAFQEEIEADYPLLVQDQQIASRIEISGMNPGFAPSFDVQGPTAFHQFTDETGTWAVTLASNSLSLETRSYVRFEDFIGRLRKVLDALVTIVRPSRLERIGLRYINEIRVDADRIADVVRQEFLGPLSVPVMANACTQASHFINLKYDDARLNLQYGFLQEGTTIKPRENDVVPSGSFFLLDFDMYREFAGAELKALSPDMILSNVGSYHVTISDLFRWATTEAYRASIGVNPNVGE